MKNKKPIVDMSDLNREDFSSKEWKQIYNKRYDQSENGRASQKRKRQTEAHKISQKKYNQSLNGKTTKRLRKYRYRTKKLNSNVSWANEESIKLIYQEAVRRTEETGTQYDVDHFIPLQGKNVSGLHVEGNLKVMLHTDNCSKQNIFTPEMEQSVILEMA